MTGESEFCEQGAEHDFQQFYDTRIEILEKDAQKKSKRHRELMKYFNDNLFPNESSKNTVTLEDEEARLLKAISEEEDGEELDGGGDHEEFA